MKILVRRAILGAIGILYNIFRLFTSIKADTALFSAYSGSGVIDSPRYMLEALSERDGFRIFAVSRDPARDSASLPEGVRAVRYMGAAHLRLLASAKFLVTNSMFPAFFRKRPGQTLLNTWHGTPMKALGYDIPGTTDDIALLRRQFLEADYLLYPNDFTMSKMMGAFDLGESYRGKVLLCGYPRNAALFDGSGRETLRGELGAEGKTIFVYMPTWRGVSVADKGSREHGERLRENLGVIDRALGDGAILYVKLHTYEMKRIDLDRYSHIFKAPDGYEPYEFLSAADALISDYSSVIFDFANTGRPILLFTYDLEEYEGRRGMYISPGDMPFFRADNAEQLAARMNAIADGGEFNDGYVEFTAEFCAWDDPDNARRVNNAFFFGNEDGVRIIDFSDRRP